MSNVDPAAAQRFLATRTALPSKPGEALTEISRRLRADFAHYNWVGVYVLEGKELVLGGWDGKEATEHVRIPVERGLCGQAAREGKTVTVGDVTSNPDYLACFPYTRSEIVVPIFSGTEVIGEIDIDGDRRNAYDASDRDLLEALATRLAPTVLAFQRESSGRSR